MHVHMHTRIYVYCLHVHTQVKKDMSCMYTCMCMSHTDSHMHGHIRATSQYCCNSWSVFILQPRKKRNWQLPSPRGNHDATFQLYPLLHVYSVVLALMLSRCISSSLLSSQIVQGYVMFCNEYHMLVRNWRLTSCSSCLTEAACALFAKSVEDASKNVMKGISLKTPIL